MPEALLIVDLQNDFLPGGALGVKGGDEIIPIINELMTKFSLIVATQDWHPPDHVSFAETHGKKVGEVIDLDGIKQELWPVHCVKHTPGSQISKEVNQDLIERYFYKGSDQGIDSYSAFFDNGHEKPTGLDAFLKEKGVTKITVAGLTTDFCVLFSVIDALKLGYEVVVVADACRPVFDDKGALEMMREAGAVITLSKDL